MNWPFFILVKLFLSVNNRVLTSSVPQRKRANLSNLPRIQGSGTKPTLRAPLLCAEANVRWPSTSVMGRDQNPTVGV
ncbi:hypothetical protein [Paraglaciecola sp. MB-3u-78]|uniref:hypothetical protein n=1 Tax=Paraglaciecola sp. MB-3u-78 TaxID=2058332 RepID=UPI0012FF3059|nr:hypothetical protein [Paraglaciecola sp. MB-3u-78]